MRRTRTRVAAIGATAAMVGMSIISASGPASASPRPTDRVLAGSAVPFTSHTRAIGYVAGSERLSIQVWLRPQLAAAAHFASAVSTPGNPLFHHYLRPDGYTARFGATRSEATKVESWLRTEGFAGIHTDSQRTYVRATATTSKIDAAFHVQLRLYRSSATVNAGPYTLRANDRAISVPRSLAGSVLGVTGLDNAAPILPIDRPSSKAARRAGARDRFSWQPQGPLLSVLRAACGHRLADTVWNHVIPDRGMRLHRRPDPGCLRGQHAQNRQGPDHRPGGVGPD